MFPFAVWKRKCQNMQNRHREALLNWPVYQILRWKSRGIVDRLRPVTDMEEMRCTKCAQWLSDRRKDSDQYADVVLMRGKSKIVPFHAIKAYCGIGVTSPLILNRGTNWRWVVNPKPDRFSPEKEHRYRWNRTLVGAQSRCRGCGEEKSFLPLPEFETRIAGHEPDNIKIVDLEKSEKKYSAVATLLYRIWTELVNPWFAVEFSFRAVIGTDRFREVNSSLFRGCRM